MMLERGYGFAKNFNSSSISLLRRASQSSRVGSVRERVGPFQSPPELAVRGIADLTRRLIHCAKVFALYLPGVETMLRATLYGTDAGERQMLFEHLDLRGEHDLLMLDLGSPASWLMAALQQRAISFSMRIDGIGGKPVKAFLRNGESEAIVALPAPHRPNAVDYKLERTPVTVRLIRVVTPEGRVRVLATYLFDANRWAAAKFGALYHQR
ncbi:hypothetical protein LFL97_32245 [Burkholderia sp. JSH-S8]|nr:hypothetical protein LFL97_32245 [Burkholderia sp. JSH-S8]